MSDGGLGSRELDVVHDVHRQALVIEGQREDEGAELRGVEDMREEVIAKLLSRGRLVQCSEAASPATKFLTQAGRRSTRLDLTGLQISGGQ